MTAGRRASCGRRLVVLQAADDEDMVGAVEVNVEAWATWSNRRRRADTDGGPVRVRRSGAGDSARDGPRMGSGGPGEVGEGGEAM